MAGPRARSRARVLGRAAIERDHADLPGVRALVSGQGACEGVGRSHALCEQVQEFFAVRRAGVGLRRDGADARPHPGHTVPHARDPRRDGYPGLTGGGVDGRDGEGVEDQFGAPRRRFLRDRRRREDERGDDRGGDGRRGGEASRGEEVVGRRARAHRVRPGSGIGRSPYATAVARFRRRPWPCRRVPFSGTEARSAA